MNLQKKLIARQTTGEEQQLRDRQQTQPQNVLEFTSVEAMLRHDTERTPVPPAIARRLQESIARLPLPPRSWWRRLLGQ
jgi:hypothetical protein